MRAAVGAHRNQAVAVRRVVPAHVGRKGHVVRQRGRNGVEAQELVAPAGAMALGAEVGASGAIGPHLVALLGQVGAGQQVARHGAIHGQHHGASRQRVAGGEAHEVAAGLAFDGRHAGVEAQCPGGQAGGQLLGQLLHAQGRNGRLAPHKLLEHKLKEIAGRHQLPV